MNQEISRFEVLAVSSSTPLCFGLCLPVPSCPPPLLRQFVPLLLNHHGHRTKFDHCAHA